MIFDRKQTRDFYDALAFERRPGRGLSCGYPERYDPEVMKSERLSREIGTILDHCLRAYPGSRESIVDLGCGTMFYRALLEERFRTVIGLDGSIRMAGAAAGAAGPGSRAFFCAGDIEQAPFADRSFDCALGFDVIHHVESPEALVREIGRLLRPGGLYIGIEPNMLNPGMLLAHLLPPEERGAVWRNWPFVLERLFSRHWGEVKISYFNLGVSAGFSGKANWLFPFDEEGGRPWSLRMALTASKE